MEVQDENWFQVSFFGSHKSVTQIFQMYRMHLHDEQKSQYDISLEGTSNRNPGLPMQTFEKIKKTKTIVCHVYFPVNQYEFAHSWDLRGGWFPSLTSQRIFGRVQGLKRKIVVSKKARYLVFKMGTQRHKCKMRRDQTPVERKLLVAEVLNEWCNVPQVLTEIILDYARVQVSLILGS